MTAKQTTKTQDNGTAPELPEPQSYTLELADYELDLLYQVLANGTFQQVAAKQIAASCQAKIEALVKQEA